MWKSLLFLILNVCCHSFDISKLVGDDWIQVYSNRYVQESTEVGWKCVKVNISSHHNDTLFISKSALLENNTPISSNLTLVPNSTTLFKSNENEIYQLRDCNENYILWTLNDDMSLFIWTRNLLEFKTYYEWRIMERFVFWNYVGYYKFPLSSYSLQCITRK